MLSTRIAEERKRAGMSQLELATALDVSPSAIGNYEQGRRVPGIDILAKMSNIFRVTLDYLVTGKGSFPDATVEKEYKKGLSDCICPWYNAISYQKEERNMKIEENILKRVHEICHERGTSLSDLKLPMAVVAELENVNIPTTMDSVYIFCDAVKIEIMNFFNSDVFKKDTI